MDGVSVGAVASARLSRTSRRTTRSRFVRDRHVHDHGVGCCRLGRPDRPGRRDHAELRRLAGPTITPDAHYHVADVLVDGVSVGAVSSYDFTRASTTNHTIAAEFAIDTYTITASARARTARSARDVHDHGVTTVNYGGGASPTRSAPDAALPRSTGRRPWTADRFGGNYGGQLVRRPSHGASVAVQPHDRSELSWDRHAHDHGFGGRERLDRPERRDHREPRRRRRTRSRRTRTTTWRMSPWTAFRSVRSARMTSRACRRTTRSRRASRDRHVHDHGRPAGSNGSIARNGVTTVNYGGSQSHTITPNAHYHIADVPWTACRWGRSARTTSRASAEPRSRRASRSTRTRSRRRPARTARSPRTA